MLVKRLFRHESDNVVPGTSEIYLWSKSNLNHLALMANLPFGPPSGLTWQTWHREMQISRSPPSLWQHETDLCKLKKYLSYILYSFDLQSLYFKVPAIDLKRVKWIISCYLAVFSGGIKSPFLPKRILNAVPELTNWGSQVVGQGQG